jgi:hypothetical protein
MAAGLGMLTILLLGDLLDPKNTPVSSRYVVPYLSIPEVLE